MGGGLSGASLRSVVSQTMGRFMPVGRLGGGGMADVYLALARGPQRVDKLAVIKRLRDPEDPELTQMFLDEARIAARLNHPNIVHTYEVGEVNGEYFIAMEYLEGEPLTEVLKELGEHGEWLSEPVIAGIAVQALKGLHYAHEFCDFDGTPLGVVHRDVSPQNLFVTHAGEVKLLDFGIAKAKLNTNRTETGVLKGKVRYMAPEQISEIEVDRRADLFSFGVVLWEMLARRELFTGEGRSLAKRGTVHIPPVSTVRPEVSAALEAIAQKALQVECNDRYATAEEMRLELQQFLRGRDEEDAQADLAGIMSRLFAVRREALRARIQAYIASAPRAPESQTSPDLKAVSLPAIGAVTEPGASLPAPTAASPTPRPPARWPLALGIAAAVALAIATGAMNARKPPPPLPPPLASAPSPSAGVPRPARLHVDTMPEGAYVQWNGELFGPTPIEIPLDPGAQTLTITRDGYQPTTLTVDAGPGEEIVGAAALLPVPSSPARDTPAPSAMARPAPVARPARSAAPLNVRMIDEDAP
jgi:serine/threonine-protein kinase